MLVTFPFLSGHPWPPACGQHLAGTLGGACRGLPPWCGGGTVAPHFQGCSSLCGCHRFACSPPHPGSSGLLSVLGALEQRAVMRLKKRAPSP